MFQKLFPELVISNWFIKVVFQSCFSKVAISKLYICAIHCNPHHVLVFKITPARDPKQQKKTKRMTNNLSPNSFKNIAKVGSYGRFDIKIGIGLKFPAKFTPLELHSSHCDPFRDQKRFQKTTLFLAASKKHKEN